MSVLLVRYVLLQQVVDGDNPAVVELSVQHHLLLLHLWLHLHHLQCGVVVVAVLHRVQLLCQVLLSTQIVSEQETELRCFKVRETYLNSEGL